MKHKLSNVSCRYGSPMGRRNTVPEGTEPVKVHLEKMALVDGDYDQGGAYWGGGGDPMWVAWANDFEVFVRASNRHAAKRSVAQEYKNVRFYR